MECKNLVCDRKRISLADRTIRDRRCRQYEDTVRNTRVDCRECRLGRDRRYPVLRWVRVLTCKNDDIDDDDDEPFEHGGPWGNLRYSTRRPSLDDSPELPFPIIYQQNTEDMRHQTSSTSLEPIPEEEPEHEGRVSTEGVRHADYRMDNTSESAANECRRNTTEQIVTEAEEQAMFERRQSLEQGARTGAEGDAPRTMDYRNQLPSQINSQVNKSIDGRQGSHPDAPEPLGTPQTLKSPTSSREDSQRRAQSDYSSRTHLMVPSNLRMRELAPTGANSASTPTHRPQRVIPEYPHRGW